MAAPTSTTGTASSELLPTVRLLHTSDVHVASGSWGIEGLAGVVRVAIEREVDAVLIAGDLFDSSRVPDDSVAAAMDELRRLGGLGRPVIVIPGNHDCVGERSIYHRVDLAGAGAHVVFVGEPEGRSLVFDELALAVWARGIEDHHPGHRPLAGYVPPDPRYWRVVVTHGHYVLAGEQSDRSSPITQEEILALECDYLALGHWHRFVDVSEGAVTACYSGSPSEPGGDGPTVNLVTLCADGDKRAVEVERLPL